MSNQKTLLRLSMCALLISGSASYALAADNAASASTAKRPRIGLVLSGGGARGSAHIGVLKELDALHIPVDAVAGTSMGAVVGGLYASGMSGAEIEQLLSSVDWQDAFRDRPARSALAFRRKEEDRDFLVNLPLGLQGKKLLLPTGLVQGQKLTQILRAATAGVATISDFDRLAIPFRAVATDLESGAAVVLKDGDLTTALRASMSAPGVFAPVERDDRLLVDGGLVKNLPIDVARGMGVDILIVVDTSPPLDTRAQLDSLARVSNQSLAIMIRRDTDAQKQQLGVRDVLLAPDLERMSSYDFSHLSRAVAAGTRAALAHRDALAALAIGDDDYRQLVAQRRAVRTGMPVIGFVRATAESQRYADQIKQRFGDLVGTQADAGELEERITNLYGQGNFELLDYRLTPGSSSAADAATTATPITRDFGLDISARRNSWGPNYLRLGLSLQDDFSGNSQFNAAGRLLLTELNPLNGELALNMQVGEEPLVAAEFYQPLSLGRQYFVAPHVQLRAYNVPQIDGDKQIGEFRVRSQEFGIDTGVELGNWGELRGGLLNSRGRTRIRLGDPAIADTHFDVNAAFARFAYDRLDAANFPRRGQAFSAELRFEANSGASGQGSDLLSVDWRGVRSYGKNTGVLWLSAGETAGGNRANVRTWFPLGGFLNLSGLQASSLAGPHYFIARGIYFRQVGRGGEGVLNVPGYVGVSLEAGNVWHERRDIGFDSMRMDASVFFGADTYIGPAYLAMGYDQSGNTALYLFLGKSF